MKNIIIAIMFSFFAFFANAEPSFNQIQTLIASQEYRAAEKGLEEIIANHPKSAKAFYAMAQGYVCSVWDGEEWQVLHCSKYQKIIYAIESVEEAELKIRSANLDDLITWVRVSAFGLADDETVVDYYDNKFMTKWSLTYDKCDTI